MTPIELSIVIFSCVFTGGLAGIWLRTVVPQHHLSADTKEVVKLGVALIGTMAALVLGLLVASAKSSYDTRSSELTQMSVNAILLDRILAHYGPETAQIRAGLKAALGRMDRQIWPRDGRSLGGLGALVPNREILFDELQSLRPKTDAQRSLQSQAESMAISLGQTQWLLFEQNGSAISTPFLVVVVFWLTTLFVSFGMFAPNNLTVDITLLVAALSVAGAIFLILELDRPFVGLLKISDAPLKKAIAVLGK